MTGQAAPEPAVRHYFVDEAGDSRLFDAAGRTAAGSEGCSRYFMLGMLDVAEPALLAHDLAGLRQQLLADPYFRGVPSMCAAYKKTAVAFHAKDDIPEVRREVFALLMRHQLRFQAVVRDKTKVGEVERQRRTLDPGYRYNPNQLYDSLVRRLFKNLLHKDDGYDICFAKRGKSDRTEALETALVAARRRFAKQWQIVSTAPIRVIPTIPPQEPGLQAVDYFLWALQRLYERRESRYLEFVWPAISLVHDVDDTRCANYGVYYTKKKPLTLAALEELPGV